MRHPLMLWVSIQELCRGCFHPKNPGVAIATAFLLPSPHDAFTKSAFQRPEYRRGGPKRGSIQGQEMEMDMTTMIAALVATIAFASGTFAAPGGSSDFYPVGHESYTASAQE